MTIKTIINEQLGDQCMHFAVGALVSLFFCSMFSSVFGAIIPALGWIYWEHLQYPHHNSKGYDDQSIDRFFQEAGLFTGMFTYYLQ